MNSQTPESLKDEVAARGLTYASALHSTVDDHADRVQELSAIRNVLASLEHFDESSNRAFQAVADTLIEESAADGCAILLSTDTNFLTVRAARRYPVQVGTTGDLRNATDAPYASLHEASIGTFARGKPLVSPDVSIDPHFNLSEQTRPRVRSLVVWPLRAKGRVVGVIVLTHPRPNVLNEAIQRLLSLIEAQLGIVLNHLMTAESAQRRSSHLAFEAARVDAELSRLRSRIEGQAETGESLPELVESIPVPLCMADPADGRLESWNNAFAQLTDYDSSDLSDLRLSKLLAEPSEWEMLATEVAHHGGFLNREYLLRRPFGRQLWASVSAHTVAVGDRTFILLTVLDIERHKRTESSLEKIESKLRRKVKEQDAIIRLSRAVHGMSHLSDLAPLMSVFLRELKILGVPADTVAIHRLVSEEEKVFETVRLVFGRVQTARYGDRQRLFDCWRSGKPEYRPTLTEEEAEHISQKMNGREVRSMLDFPFAHGVASIHSSQRRAFDGVRQGLLQEMSEMLSVALARLRDIEALQVSERRLRQIIDSVSVGICLVDDEQRILVANSAARALLKALDARPEDGVSWLGDRPWEEVVAVPAGTPVEFSRDEDRTYEVVHYRADTPEEEDTVLLLRDITEQREKSLRLQQQDRLAVVGELAAGIAHDFNNTLTATVGASDLVRELGGVPENVKRHLDLISREGDRASRLVRQILDFSRKTEVERFPVSLDKAVVECCHLLNHVMPEGIDLRVETDGESKCVRANDTQLQQVITNLVLNARDAMPETGRVTLKTETVSLQAPRPLGTGSDAEVPAGKWVTLTVSDTGPGIPRDVRKRIFEPFFTTKPQGEGTGLGLSQVFGIVKQHEGYIDVREADGGGAAFVVYLPPTRSKAEAEPEPEVVRGDRTILVVEDKPEAREITVSLVEQLGYRVLTAVGGAEALEIFRAKADEIDLVLTDLHMPGMTGRQLATAVLEVDPAATIIIASGVAVTQAAPGPRGVSWIQKPFRMADLSKALADRLTD